MVHETVLVTGFSGFVGTAVALQLLQAGYHVKGAVRSPAKAKAWLAKYPQYASSLDFEIVTDMTATGAFDRAVDGVDYIMHCASPLGNSLKGDAERDILLPAIRGTTSILDSAARPGSKVKRFVYTSSLGAMEVHRQPWNPNHVYDETKWCPTPYARAKVEKEDGSLVYKVSKREAEQTVLSYPKKHSARFDVVSVVPTSVFGPTQQPVETLGDMPLSCVRIGSFFGAETLPDARVAPPMIDVKDLALCHVRAMELPHASGQRYLCGVHGHTPAQIAYILRKAFPEEAHRIPEGNYEPFDPAYKWDSSKAVRELQIDWTPKEITIVETGRQWLAIEKQTKPK